METGRAAIASSSTKIGNGVMVTTSLLVPAAAETNTAISVIQIISAIIMKAAVITPKIPAALTRKNESKPQTKLMINDACVTAGKPFVHAGVLETHGQIMTF